MNAKACSAGMKYSSRRRRCEISDVGKITQADLDRTKLSQSQRRLVDTMKDVAFATMKKKPLSGVVQYQLASSFQTVFKLRNIRNKSFERGDMDRVFEANDREDDIITYLKHAGVPFHPALAHRVDWERL